MTILRHVTDIHRSIKTNCISRSQTLLSEGVTALLYAFNNNPLLHTRVAVIDGVGHSLPLFFGTSISIEEKKYQQQLNK